MSKLAGIVQKGNESPSEFYERLCEAYRLYTPINPEATGSQIVINLASHPFDTSRGAVSSLLQKVTMPDSS